MNWKRLFAAILGVYFAWAAIKIYTLIFTVELSNSTEWALGTGGGFTVCAVLVCLYEVFVADDT